MSNPCNKDHVQREEIIAQFLVVGGFLSVHRQASEFRSDERRVFVHDVRLARGRWTEANMAEIAAAAAAAAVVRAIIVQTAIGPEQFGAGGDFPPTSKQGPARAAKDF